jgi:Flp pilus assembly pilin Flp
MLVDLRHGRGATKPMCSLAEFLKDDEATTAVEYSVMLAVIILVALSAIGALGTKTNSVWGWIVSSTRACGM